MSDLVQVVFEGAAPLIVETVGEWIPGDTKTIDKDLADRLLRRPDFDRVAVKVTKVAKPALKKAATPDDVQTEQ